MTVATTYMHIKSTTMSPWSLTRSGYEVSNSPWMCTGCFRPKPASGPIDVQVDSGCSKQSPLNLISRCLLPVVNEGFIKDLALDAFGSDFLCGSIIDDRNRKVAGWSTVFGRHKIIVRGSAGVRNRKCDVCGQNSYFATGQRYLFPAPPKEATIFESHLCGFVVPSGLVDESRLKKWRGITTEHLEVLPAPLDNLGDLSDTRT